MMGLVISRGPFNCDHNRGGGRCQANDRLAPRVTLHMSQALAHDAESPTFAA
jgi:hypothetical protein